MYAWNKNGPSKQDDKKFRNQEKIWLNNIQSFKKKKEKWLAKNVLN